jgi:DNA invertase Pin-like site-specific DNA recombinase
LKTEQNESTGDCKLDLSKTQTRDYNLSMARHPEGTTPKLTNKLIEDVVTLIAKGNYIEAAAACGIAKDTLYRWLRLAHSPEANL